MVDLKLADDRISFGVHVTPAAKRNGVGGMHDGCLKVAVTAAPDKGKANEAVIELVAKAFGLRRSQCLILSGQTSRRKVIQIQGADPQTLSAAIQQLAAAGT